MREALEKLYFQQTDDNPKGANHFLLMLSAGYKNGCFIFLVVNLRDFLEMY